MKTTMRRGAWRALVSLLALFHAHGMATAGPIGFKGRTPVATGMGDPGKVVLADLDGDGAADLVTAVFGQVGVGGTSRLVWQKNLGRGSTGRLTFGPEQVISREPLVVSVSGVAVADVDKDGLPDVLSASFQDAKIAWYRNLGGGDFGDPAANQRIISTSAIGAFSVNVADFDGDGDLDALSASQSDSRVVWYANPFPDLASPWIATEISNQADGARYAVAVDLDRDGDQDVLSASVFGAPIAWYENLGGGDFGDSSTNQQVISDTVQSGRWVIAADVDGDGDPDPVSASCTDDTVAWFQTANPPAPPWNMIVISATAACPEAVAAADLDGDGDVDILAATATGVRWYENGDGGTAWTAHALPLSVAAAVDVGPVDADGDGDLDVISASSGDDGLFAFQNRTIHRNFTAPFDNSIENSLETTSLDVADFDRDGDLDVVQGTGSDEQVQWIENHGGGSFDSIHPITSSSNMTERVLTGDFDRNATSDVVSAASDPLSGLIWYPNSDGQGTFPLGDRVIAGGTEGSTFSYLALAAGHLNQDSLLDLVAAGADGPDGVLGTADDVGTIEIWINDIIEGEASFIRLQTISLDGTTRVRGLATGDVDRDGDLDLLVGAATPAGGQVRVYLNDGSGSFSILGDPLPTSQEVSAAALGDLDKDGDLDYIFGATSSIMWSPNTDGAGTVGFAQPVTTEVKIVEFLDVADLDGDGDLDILAASSGDNTIAWHENLGGTGLFAPRRVITSGAGGARAVKAADVDGDGDLDVVFGAPLTPLLAWNTNLGGQFTFGGSSLAPPTAFAGQLVPMLRIAITVHARPGDPVAQVTSLGVSLEDGLGQPLDSLGASAVISRLLVYRDDGSGAFEPAADILIAVADANPAKDGSLSIPLPAGDPNTKVAAPAGFIVVLELTNDAGFQDVTSLRVNHVSALTGVRDSESGLSLSASLSALLSSDVSAIQQPLVVNTFLDDEGDDVVPLLSLRAAVRVANSTPGPDLILLEAGTYILDDTGPAEDNANSGDLDVTDASGTLTIRGAGAAQTVIDAGGIDRVFDLIGGAGAVFEGLTITGGSAPGAGGGIQIAAGSFVTLDDVIVTGNSASTQGGGIYTDGDLTLLESSVSDNMAEQEAGGILVAFNGVLTAQRSLMAGNTSAFIGGLSVDGTLNLINSTLFGNHGDQGAGAISVDGLATITSSTITQNSGGTTGGIDIPEGNVSLRSTILAGNSGTWPDCAGTMNSLGFNLLGTDLGCTLNGNAAQDQIGGEEGLDPLLGLFQDNGGNTFTVAPLPISPAVDAGSCPALAVDQRGQPRVLDVPALPDPLLPADDGCDVGAVELGLGQLLNRITVPVRWCTVAGTPSIGSSQTAANAVLLGRLQQASEAIFEPQGNIKFVSGATPLNQNFFILPDPVVTPGSQAGDVFIDPLARNYDEFLQLIASCRTAWEAADPLVTGITAVHIRRFVDGTGAPLPILGAGGRAAPGSAAQQAVAGRVMVIDDFFRQGANPPDVNQQLLGHELGHGAGALPHGNGLDDDANGILDDGDDAAVELATFDGPNLMQYRNGIQLSLPQVIQSRVHILSTIPDITVTSSVSSDDVPIEEGFLNIADFGFLNIADFGFLNIADFGFLNIADFEEEESLDFGFLNIADFGMDFGGSDGTSDVFVSTAGLHWPDPIQADSFYYFYLDLDNDDATGGLPSDFGFPGAGVTVEAGTDLIARVEVTISGNLLTVFDFDEFIPDFVEVPGAGSAAVENLGLSILQETGGQDPEREEQAVGVNVLARIQNSILQGAGWTIGSPVGLETLTAIDCNTTLEAGFVIDCQCTDCAACPEFPGCAETGVPDTIDADNLVAQTASATLEFVAPVLPQCNVSPESALAGAPVAVSVSGFPTGIEGALVEVRAGSDLLGTSPLDASGATVAGVNLPADAVAGPLELVATLQGQANSVDCDVTILSLASACSPDTDAPTLQLPVPDPLVVTCSQLNPDGTGCAKIDDPEIAAWLASAAATDVCDPAPVVAHDAPAVFPMGSSPVTFTATDASGNVAQGTATVQVVYEFGGFSAPLLADGSASIRQAKKGRVIPVKFPLFCGGLPAPEAVASISVFKVTDAASGTVDTTDLTDDAGKSADGGNLFRYDADAEQYIFNLSTRGFDAPATFRIVVTLDDETQQVVEFSLRQ